MKFDVYDDIISPTYQDVIENLLSSPDVSWSWQDSMDDGGYGGYPQFVFDIFDNGKAFDNAVKQLIKLHARCYKESGLEKSSVLACISS